MKRPILVSVLLGCSLVASAWTGSGTQNDPYLLATEDDLVQLRSEVNAQNSNDYANTYFALTCDIALTKPWTPIGSRTAFKGNLDGRNHGVSNVQITSNARYTGFFAWIENNTISNFRILSGSIVGDSIVGGVVGYAKDATLDNCANVAAVSGKCQVGGVVGNAYNAQVKRTFNIGAVSSNYAPQGYNFYAVGGVVGYADGSAEINSCYNAGSVASSGEVFRTGGLAGEVNNATMRYCYNIGRVAGQHAGAVLGQQTSSTLEQCYADAQLCPDLKAIASTATTFESVKTVPTKQLTALDEFGLFTANTDVNRYSYYSADIDNDPLVRVSVAAITLADDDEITAVDNDFVIGDASIWQCSNHKVQFANGKARVDVCKDGTDQATVTATAGSYSRQIALKIENRCTAYTKDDTEPQYLPLCASDLPYIFSDKTATTLTANDFDFANKDYTINRDLTFATVEGCDSVVNYTITCYPLPTATLSDDIATKQRVLKGQSIQVVYELDGAGSSFEVKTWEDVTYFSNNGVFSYKVPNITQDMTFSITSLTCTTDDNHTCSAADDGLGAQVEIKVVDEVQIDIATVEGGTMTDTDPSVKADGKADKIYRIEPEEGWYLSKLENDLDEDEIENVYIDGGKLCYAFTPTKDTKLTPTFARIEKWNGVVSKPFMTRDRDSIYIYTPQELGWVAEQFASTASAPNPAPARAPYTRDDVDWTTTTIALQNDLDCGGVCDANYSWSGTQWEPIGTVDNPFTATFDGQNHEIKNLYISDASSNYLGLFGKIDNTAELKNFAITFGSVSGGDYVGCVAGYNDGGHIHHCYNMAEILKANLYAGGIVGYNGGTIEYAYNVGLLHELNEYGGGIAGYNGGTVQYVYGVADAWKGKTKGALVGKNEGTLVNAYWDNQMSSSVVGDKSTVDPTVISLPTERMPNAFADDAEDNNWIRSEGLYPQLNGLNGTEAAFASVSPVLLAEANGSLENAHAVRHDFKFDIKNSVTWSTPNDNWLEISGNSAKILYDDCYGTTVFVVAKCGSELRRASVNIRLDGDFNTQSIDNKTDTACTVADIQYISGTKPTGGNSDTYVYRWLYTIGDDPAETKLVEDTTFSDERYEYLPQVTEPGTYHFYREAKDNACEQNYVRSGGVWTLVLLPPFDAGAIKNLDDLKLCSENEIPTLQDSIAATGGDGNISYRWTIDGDEITDATEANYTPTADQLADNKPHTFVRQAKDGKCNDWTASKNSVTITLLAEFTAGAIEDLGSVEVCSENDIPTLKNSVAATGGDGNISYSWTMDGDEITDATEANYTPTADQLADNKAHTFVRQAKDGTCNDTWENSANSVTITLLPAFDAGAIKSLGSVELCSENEIPMLQDSIAATGGDGNITYRWTMDGDDITDATGADYTPTADQLNDNKPHTFVRQAKDGTCNDWTASTNSVTITLLATFDAGAIVAVTDELLCLDGDQTTLTVENETVATGGDGNITYRWTITFYDTNKELLGTDNIENKEPDLTYEFDKAEQLPSAAYPIYVTIVREANDTRCHTDWEQSGNEASYIVAQNEALSRTINVCERDFPYTYTYTYNATAKGTKQITFDAPDDVRVIDDDATVWGCLRTVTITAKATPTPTVAIVDSLLEVCEGETSGLFVEIEPLKGTPTKYKLLFDDPAFTSVTTFTNIPSNRRIPITPVGTPAPRIYTASLIFLGGTSSCESEERRLEISVSLDGYLHQKWNDVIVVNNSGTLPDKPLTFIAYQWYRDGQIVDGATLQHIYEPNGLSSVYYALLTDASGVRYRTCDFYPEKKSVASSARIKVYPVPVRQGETVAVELPFATELLEGGSLEICNAQGVKLFVASHVEEQNLVDEHFAPGIYLVRFVDSQGNEQTAKFIVK